MADFFNSLPRPQIAFVFAVERRKAQPSVNLPPGALASVEQIPRPRAELRMGQPVAFLGGRPRCLLLCIHHLDSATRLAAELFLESVGLLAGLDFNKSGELAVVAHSEVSGGAPAGGRAVERFLPSATGGSLFQAVLLQIENVPPAGVHCRGVGVNAGSLRELKHISIGQIEAVNLAGSGTLRSQQQKRIVPRDKVVMVVRQVMQDLRIGEPKQGPSRQGIDRFDFFRGDLGALAGGALGGERWSCRGKKSPSSHPPHRT